MNQVLITLISIYLLILPFGQLLRIPTNYSSAPIHAADLVVGIIYLVWLLGFVIKKEKAKLSTSLNEPMAVFSIIALVSWLVSALSAPLSETIIAGLYLIRWVAYASLFVITFSLSRVKNYNRQINKTLILSFVLIAIFGFSQYLIFPNLKPLLRFEWDEHYYRLTSTFLDPGFTGILLIIGLIYVPNIKSQITNLLKVILGALFYIAIVLTYSRATYLALFSAALIWIWLKKSFQYALILILIIAFTWTLIPHPAGEGGNLSRTSTINFRLINYQQALQVFKDHPLLGVGFNRYRYAQRDYGFISNQQSQTSHSAAGVDNSFLLILVTTGILGLSSYLWLWLTAIKTSWKIASTAKSPKNILLSRSLFLILIALTIHAQFHNTLFYPSVMGITWILLGLSINK